MSWSVILAHSYSFEKGIKRYFIRSNLADTDITPQAYQCGSVHTSMSQLKCFLMFYHKLDIEMCVCGFISKQTEQLKLKIMWIRGDFNCEFIYGQFCVSLN